MKDFVDFDAFMSYRHVEPDRTWANRLHNALETYRVPAKLAAERNLAQPDDCPPVPAARIPHLAHHARLLR